MKWSKLPAIEFEAKMLFRAVAGLSMVCTCWLLSVTRAGEPERAELLAFLKKAQSNYMAQAKYGQYEMLEIKTGKRGVSPFGYIGVWDHGKCCVYVVTSLQDAEQSKVKFLAGEKIFSLQEASIVILKNERYQARLRPKGAAGATEDHAVVDDVALMKPEEAGDTVRLQGLVLLGSTEFWPYILAKSTTQVKRLTKNVEYNGNACIKAELEVMHPWSDKGDVPATMIGFFDAKDGLVHRMEMKMGSITAVDEFRYVAPTKEVPFKFPQYFHHVRDVAGGVKSESEYNYRLISTKRPGSSQFYLTGFGCPDPFPQELSLNIFSIGSIGAGTILLGAGFWARRKAAR